MAKRKRRPAKNQAKLDIVIPVYGQAKMLESCLASIQTDIKHNLIVVDDCGPDQEALGQIYAGLNGTSTVIRQKENQGFPATVNRGINLGTSPYVLILNTDVRLQPNAIETMVKEFDDNPQAGIVGPKLLFTEDTPHGKPGTVQHAGLGVTFDGDIIHCCIGWASDNPKVNRRLSIQAVTGACMMIRRTILSEIYKRYKVSGVPTRGPLNEMYGKGTYEDVELCFATRALGYEVIYQPLAVGTHYVGASVVGNKESYPLNRNRAIFEPRCGDMLVWDEMRFL